MVSEIRPLILRRRTTTWWRSNAFSASRRLFDLKGKTRTVSKNESSTIIAQLQAIPSAQRAGSSFRYRQGSAAKATIIGAEICIAFRWLWRRRRSHLHCLQKGDAIRNPGLSSVVLNCEHYEKRLRYAVGASPVTLRKAAVNELGSWNPTDHPMSVIERSVLTSSLFARSMRRFKR